MTPEEFGALHRGRDRALGASSSRPTISASTEDQEGNHDERTGPPSRHRTLDQQGRRQALPVEQGRGRSGEDQRHDPVRARLLDGLAADLRSRRAGPAGFLRDGVLRQAGLRLLVRRHGGLRPLHQGPRQQRADFVRRRRLLRRRDLYPETARAAPSPRLRHLVGRAARRRCSPSGIPKWSTASRSTRTVWTGEGSPTLAERRKKLPEFQSKNRRPIDRAFVHSIFNRDHPGTAEEQRHRRVRGRDPEARRQRADRHLCRHVLEAAGRTIRRTSRSRRSSCAASGTASRASTT